VLAETGYSICFPTEMCDVESDQPPSGNSNENFSLLLHNFTILPVSSCRDSQVGPKSFGTECNTNKNGIVIEDVSLRP
jgi:hypothetical protein